MIIKSMPAANLREVPSGFHPFKVEVFIDDLSRPFFEWDSLSVVFTAIFDNAMIRI